MGDGKTSAPGLAAPSIASATMREETIGPTRTGAAGYFSATMSRMTTSKAMMIVVVEITTVDAPPANVSFT